MTIEKDYSSSGSLITDKFKKKIGKRSEKVYRDMWDRHTKGDGLDFEVEDEDHFDSFEKTDFSSLADMDY